MNVELIVVGKTDSPQVAALVEMYQKRISNYVRFGITIVPDVRTFLINSAGVIER